MVKLRLVCDSFHNFIEYMFFVKVDVLLDQDVLLQSSNNFSITS